MKYVRYDLIDNTVALLQPNRQQAITWSNDGMFYWRVYASFGIIVLNVIDSPVSF